MDFFVIDTVGETSHHGPKPKLPKVKLPQTYLSVFDGSTPAAVEPKQEEKVEEESEEEDDYGGLPPPGESIANILSKDIDDVPIVLDTPKRSGSLPSFRADTRAGTSKGMYTRRGITKENELNQTDVNAEMKQTVLTPGIEKKEDIARLGMKDDKLKKLNRAERKKTKGRNWFDMAAPEITPEVSNELTLIKMRSVLDPKKVYGRVEKRKTPKYFEIGTVIESPLDHYNERGIKRSKKQSLVDELLADAEFQKYNKRKYAEALEKKKKKAYHKAAIKMKHDKKKKK
uniref:Fcf2 pre-rRNA processing C-terminal domain-containing protein n=1 Tax=Anopheles atroparvus TaxID=41427 RepID=A0AAG5DJP1_ANOAO